MTAGDSGRYGIVGGRLGAMLGCALLGPPLGRITGRSIGLLMLRTSIEIQRSLPGLLPRPVIDSVQPFDAAPAAFARALSGRSVGKIVIDMTPRG